MLGIGYHKAPQTAFVQLYARGKLTREGAGLSFLYCTPVSTIVQVPLESRDLPFAFKEVTGDFQEVTVQGQLCFRVRDPRRLAGLLDFSLKPGGGYASQDPLLLPQRLAAAAQARARSALEKISLRDALAAADGIREALLKGLPADPAVELLGLEILGVTVLSLRPAPELARALEAEARERLKGEADDAVYERRNASVDQERKIKENELNTELAVEDKRRALRERKMQADIAVEEARAELLKSQDANDRKAADSKAYALQALLKPVRDLDWRVLIAATTGSLDPKLMIASAFRDLAENAGRIGQLNISPDLLATLLKEPGGK